MPQTCPNLQYKYYYDDMHKKVADINVPAVLITF
jgi:hypothetical protein